MRTYFLYTAFYLLTALSTICSGQSSKTQFSFVFMTDLHLRPDPQVSEAFGKVIDTVRVLRPDFVLAGGDQVYDVMRGNVAKSDSLFQFYVRESRKFGVPVHSCVGNHELFGIYEESDVDSTHADYKYGMFERYLGKTYYSFDHKGWHFIVLNNLDVRNKKYIGRVSEGQMEWLRRDLERVSPETPVVLTVHIPLVSAFRQIYPQANESDGPMVENRDEILAAFKRHNLKFVLQGHLHWMEDLYLEGKTHFITGGAIAGRPSWRGTNHGPRGFLYFTVAGDNASWRFIDYEGRK